MYWRRKSHSFKHMPLLMVEHRPSNKVVPVFQCRTVPNGAVRHSQAVHLIYTACVMSSHLSAKFHTHEFPWFFKSLWYKIIILVCPVSVSGGGYSFVLNLLKGEYLGHGPLRNDSLSLNSGCLLLHKTLTKRFNHFGLCFFFLVWILFFVE